MDDTRKQAMSQCYSCVHKRTIPGDAHIQCVNPDDAMEGYPHGIRMGWWMYPVVFDPTWNLTICRNHKEREGVATT